MIRMPIRLGYGGVILFGFRMATFSPWPCTAFPGCMCMHRARSGVSPAFYEYWSHRGGFTLKTSFKSDHLPKASFPHTVARGDRASIYEFWKDPNISPWVVWRAISKNILCRMFGRMWKRQDYGNVRWSSVILVDVYLKSFNFNVFLWDISFFLNVLNYTEYPRR